MKKLYRMILHTGIGATVLILSVFYCAGQSTGFVCEGMRYTTSAPAHGALTTSSCAPSAAVGSAFNTRYQKKENYAPVDGNVEALYADKTIKIHISVLREIAGPRVNFAASDSVFIRRFVSRVNDYLAHIQAPSDPLTIDGRNPYVRDSRLRLELVGEMTFRNDVEANKGNLESVLESHPGYYYDPENILNIFLVYDKTNPAASGWVANGPDIATGDDLLRGIHERSGLTYIALNNFYTNPLMAANPDRCAAYFLHELGHFLGVNHTYCKDFGNPKGSSACQPAPDHFSGGHYDYLKDVFGTGSGAMAPRPADCGAYPSGNPFYDPADLRTANDSFTNNFMGGNPAGQYISPMQLGRIHRNAHFLVCRKFMYNTYPEPPAHDHSGQGQVYALEISGEEAWDFDIKMYSDIRVRENAKLTIRCKVGMPYHANIIVEPGGQLIIDGGTITADRTAENYFWYGIQVWGDVRKDQEWTLNQGYVQIKNGGTIENALHGIVLGDEVFGSLSRAGGIAHIDSAHFINNKLAVEFWAYHNNLYWGPLKYRKPNRSRISNTSFEVNDDYPLAAALAQRRPLGAVSLWEVDGIKVSRCTFDNKMSLAKEAVTGSDGAEGIISYEAGYTVSNSTFRVYKNGIHADGVVSGPLSVSNSAFSRNLRGMLVNGNTGLSVNNADFDMYNTHYKTPRAAGIWLYGVSNFDIAYNNFKCGDPALVTDPAGYGLLAEQCSANDNNVHHNSYYRLSTGNVSRGKNTNGQHSFLADNHGLFFRCNAFTRTNTDIGVYGADSTVDGIKCSQGTADIPAGNRFNGSTLRIYKNIYTQWDTGGNLVLPIDAYYYGAATGPYPDPTCIPGRVTKIKVIASDGCEDPGILPSGGPGAATTVPDLIAALNDSSAGRLQLVTAAYEQMNSPYAVAELSFYYIREGLTDKGQDLYNGIFTGERFRLDSAERTEFKNGGILLRMLARHQEEGQSSRYLSSADRDSLRYLVTRSVMWPGAKACAWLHFALGEDCSGSADEIPQPDTNLNAVARARLAVSVVPELKIRPNPAHDHMELLYELDRDALLQISDASGHRITEWRMDHGQYHISIPVSEWLPGVYIYKVIQDNQIRYHGKIFKQ